ncbi:hypothetical protein D3C76_169600 [compost metagenome]
MIKTFTWERFSELSDSISALELKFIFKGLTLSLGQPQLTLENPTTGTTYVISGNEFTDTTSQDAVGKAPEDVELHEQKIALRKIPRGDELTVCIVDPIMRKLQLYHNPSNYFFEVQLCSEKENMQWDKIHGENNSMRKRIEELEQHLMELEHVEKERAHTEELLDTLTRQREHAESELTRHKEELASVKHQLKKNEELYAEQLEQSEPPAVQDAQLPGALDLNWQAQDISWDEFMKLIEPGNPRLKIHPKSHWLSRSQMLAEDSQGKYYNVYVPILKNTRTTLKRPADF